MMRFMMERVFLILLFLPALVSGAEQLTAVPSDQRVDILIDGNLFTSYRYPSDWKFPYLWPVNGPLSGESLTIEKGVDYPHHRSLYFGCDKVNGCDYWQEGLDRGRIVSKGPRILEEGARLVLEDTCEWTCSTEASPILDHREIQITAPSPNLRLIDFRFTFFFLTGTHIAPSNHSLFAAEMVPELSVKGSGTICNASGEVNEAGTFGKKSVWCDYRGERKGIAEGLAIFQHPANPGFPWPWFTRDYGFFSPTPMHWLPEEGLRYQQGERVVLRFLAAVHAGGLGEGDLAKIYREWIQSPGGFRNADP
jgi:hypothetical protein